MNSDLICDEDLIPEIHPWNYYVPVNAKTLIIGTFPTAKRNWSFEFFYPNKRNLLWKILAVISSKEIMHLKNENAVAERRQLLDFLKVGITDMGKRVKRFRESSLDEKLVLVEAMDIIQIINEHLTIKKIILTSSSGAVSALRWFIKYLNDKNLKVVIPKGKKPLSFFLLLNNVQIEVHILYSPSPRAANRISFPALVEMYEKVIN